MEETKRVLRLSNDAYDLLKWVAMILLPALGTLYFALSAIWGFPAGEQVIGTITAIDVFLGVILGISTKQYVSSGAAFDGAVIVDPVSATDTALSPYRLEFERPLEELTSKPTLTLQVVNSQG